MKFSTTWKSSKKPTKQRNYARNAPLHIKSHFLSTHLSDELSKKFNRRSIRVSKGDKVKIMKGEFKGKTGQVELVDLAKARVQVTGAEIQKKDGTKVKRSVHVSSIMITELNLNDKKRTETLKRK